jgi:hypothetical protein
MCKSAKYRDLPISPSTQPCPSGGETYQLRVWGVGWESLGMAKYTDSHNNIGGIGGSEC